MTDQITNWIHESIDTLHSRTVRPLLIAVRGLIVSAFVVIVAATVFVAAMIGLFRLFDVTVFPGRVWITDYIFGGFFLTVGLMLLRRSRPKRRSGAKH